MEDAIPKLDSEGQGSVFDNMFYHRLFFATYSFANLVDWHRRKFSGKTGLF